MPNFDIAAVRADFPILERQINNKPLVYLDNAASTQKPQAVIDSLTNVYSHSYANVHRGVHTLAEEATQALENTRSALAQYLGASQPSEIVFTSGATAALNLAAHTCGSLLQAGDEVLVSLAEHHSNFVPWHMLRARGVVLKPIALLPCGSVDVQQAIDSITPRTKVIALTHVSNVTGGRTDIATLTAAARAHGIITVIDGAQGAAHTHPLQVAAWGIDMYACTAHKMYAPSGVGALYIRNDLAQTLPPFLGGGEMIASVSFDNVTYAPPPHRFEAGTPAIAPIIAWGAALQYLQPLLPQGLAHESTVYQHAVNCLTTAVPQVQIYGNAAHKAPVLAFNLPNVHPLDAAMYFNLQGVALRAGMHCAELLMNHLGVRGTLRASFALYNTMAEAEMLATTAAACVRALS